MTATATERRTRREWEDWPWDVWKVHARNMDRREAWARQNGTDYLDYPEDIRDAQDLLILSATVSHLLNRVDRLEEANKPDPESEVARLSAALLEIRDASNLEEIGAIVREALRPHE